MTSNIPHSSDNLYRAPKSHWRRWLRRTGPYYFRLKRYVEHRLTNRKWSTMQASPLEYLCFEHSTPLFRPLKHVDEYLQVNKIVNLTLAARHIDGLLIRPGETFSFWECVGRPSAQRGFVEGLVLKNGQIGKGTGGGLCQMGNLLFWMVIHSPLTVTERWRHSFDVFPDVNRTLPFGSGATLAWNYVDLQIRNETSSDWQLKVWLSETHLCGQVRSAEMPVELYQVIEQGHIIRAESLGGYSRHNRLVQQVFSATGDLLLEKVVAENHALLMYQPFVGAGA